MTQLSQERLEAIMHLAGQIDLQITEMSEEVESITIRLETLRAISAQLFAVQDGTLSDEEVSVFAKAGGESAGTPEAIVDEIVTAEMTHSPE